MLMLTRLVVTLLLVVVVNGQEQPPQEQEWSLFPLPKSAKEVNFILEQNPSAIREANKNGELPLHLACETQATSGVMNALLVAWPEAAQERVHQNKTALHLAVEHRALPHVVQMLVRVWPEAVTVKHRGNCPLHDAAAYHAYPGSISSLLQAEQEEQDSDKIQFDSKRFTSTNASCVQMADRDGLWPLHLAAQWDEDDSERPLSFSTLTYLVQAWPQGLLQPTQDAHNHHWLPLHLVCQNPTVTPEIVQFLVQEQPEAAHIRAGPISDSHDADYQGFLPLHVAIQYNANTNTHQSEVVHALLQDWKESAQEPFWTTLDDANTDMLLYPLHFAAHQRTHAQTIHHLVQAWPHSIRLPEPTTGKLPLHFACTSHHAVEPTVLLNVVQTLVHAWPQAMWQVDGANQTALEYCRMQKDYAVTQFLEQTIYDLQHPPQPSHHEWFLLGVFAMPVVALLLLAVAVTRRRRNHHGYAPQDTRLPSMDSMELA